jgi:hypothetical protein
MIANATSRVITLSERGYRMTEQDQQDRNDKALGKVMRLTYNLEHAEAAVRNVAEQMEQVVAVIRNGRRDFEPLWLEKAI